MQATVASVLIFLDITGYWSQTDMRKINWFETNELAFNKQTDLEK